MGEVLEVLPRGRDCARVHFAARHVLDVSCVELLNMSLH